MSLHDFWTSKPENRRILRSSVRKDPTQTEATEPDNMAGAGEDNDSLVAKISDAVFAKLGSCLDTKLDQILKSVNSVVEKVKVVEQRMEDGEQRISSLEDTVSELQAHLERTTTQLQDAITRLENQENFSRRNNLKIVNLPEGIETNDPRDFIETWLPKILNLTVKNDRIKVDRIHRTPAQRRTGKDATRARLVYVRLHNFTDKQKIMQKARSMGEITVDGTRIHIFEDFSPAVEKRRREFSEVKKSLRALGVEYRLLFPATLRVSHGNKTQFFKTVAEAEGYVEEMKE